MAKQGMNDRSGIRRRTLVAGTAWAIPAVAVVGAAPAFAGSPTCDDTGICVGLAEACKHAAGGDKIYHLTFSFCNTTNTSAEVCVTALTLNTNGGGDPQPTFTIPAGSCCTAEPNMCCEMTFESSQSGDTSQGTINIDYTVNGNTQTASITIPSLHPCKKDVP
ncbi:MAG: hypothetical protein ACK5MP_03130 [Nostocoides sp.]